MEKIKYTKMIIITRKEKLDVLQETLKREHIQGMTVTQVQGNGQQLGEIKYEEAGKERLMLIPKIMVEVMYTDLDTERIIEEVCKTLRTNIMGDGKIFVEECEGSIVKVRTNEKNKEAV